VKCQKLAYIAASFQSAHAEQRIVCIRVRVRGSQIPHLCCTSNHNFTTQQSLHFVTSLLSKTINCHVVTIPSSHCQHPETKEDFFHEKKQTSPTYRVCKHTDNTSYLSLSVVFYRLLSTSKHNSWHFVTLPFIMWKQDNWVTMTWLKHVATVTASIG